jgi:hypothetical protein
LREHVLGYLPEGERRVLALLIDHYPNAVGRQQIDNATSYQRSSRDAYLQRLGARELVETRGREESDDLIDRLVGAVVSGLELALCAMFCIGLVVEAAVGEWSA